MATKAAPHKCNIIIIGDGSVGKTSLLNMYSEGKITTDHMPTLGLDYITKNYMPADTTTGASMQVKIWDTAGQDRFRTLTVNFYR
mmetsp:Transcript_22599/g.27952  ORF Transcript_22599/g.27952 Transcript_22599/m.27952 type:complete len:85 (-) Transcript_22599:477-731(-)